MEMNEALREWFKEWMLEILAVDPLVPFQNQERTFEYEGESYLYGLSLKIVGTKLTLYTNYLAPNYPDPPASFSVTGNTEDLAPTVSFIENDIDQIVIFQSQTDEIGPYDGDLEEGEE